MSFYSCGWLVGQDSYNLPQDHAGWAFPVEQDQHSEETSNVEDLLVDPEDIDILPTQIQFGTQEWTDNEAQTTDSWTAFYVPVEHFYVRRFSATDSYAEFYVSDEHFYIQGFTPVNFFSEFYVRGEHFYIHDWTPFAPLYAEFYVKQEYFYIQDWTPVDFFYPVAWENC